MKKEKYKELPIILYDRYLWFYSQIEELTHKIAFGKVVQPFNTYCSKTGENIIGVAYLCWDDSLAELYIDAISIEGLNALLKDIFVRKFIKLHIIVGSKLIAEYIQAQFGLAYKNGTVKYFSNTPIKLIDKQVKEMHEEDEYLIHNLSKNVWGPYKIFIENGYKFYGLIEDDKILTMCGVTQLTAFKSEIIGVETFNENNHMKGFAKATCGFALNETLKSMDIVTWSTNLENISSCKTAESLGFKKYYTLYEFNYG